MKKDRKSKLNSIQIIAIGFALIILVGATILCLPISSKDGQSIPFVNGVFTAATSLCVTGLVVYDTFTQFSVFGQIIIAVLIQVGGLGFMTVASMVFLAFGKKIGLKERGLLMETLNTDRIGGSVRLVRKVIIGTFSIELICAAILCIRFIPQFGVDTGIYYSIFHSISAFCNAGIDLMGVFGEYSSLTTYYNDVLVNVVIMSLITIGGLGFVVWDDIATHKLKFSKYRLHTKIVLIASTTLIIVPAIIFMMLENGNTLEGMTFGEKIMASLFQVITPRTAGFNTVDTGSLTNGGTFLTMVLMFIGASPGSTGGGIKTTTFVVMIIAILSYVKNDEDMNLGKRKLTDNTFKKAYCVTGIYILLAGLSTFLITATSEISIKDAAFEVLSALSTVGLSTGITRDLSTFSRIVIIICVYCGRVGSLTVLMAVFEKKQKAKITNVEEKIIVG